MTELDAGHGRLPDTVPVILFTVRGVRMGADVNQIAELLDAREARSRGLRMARLDDYLPVYGAEPSGNSFRALVLKDDSRAPAIVVDTADAVTEIPVDAIHPIPPLVASATASRAVWGVATADDDIIVLVDLDELGHGSDGAGPRVPPATEA